MFDVCRLNLPQTTVKKPVSPDKSGLTRTGLHIKPAPKHFDVSLRNKIVSSTRYSNTS
jgi:hypothetical protein